MVDEKQSVIMSSATNGLGADVLFERRSRLEDNGGKVLQSVQFTPLLDGGTEIQNFAFKEPVKIVLRFATDAQGRPVPRTAGMSAAEVRSQGLGVAASGDDVKNLGMYWHNGIEYKKLYGDVDPVENTVTAKTPNLGRFQIRTLLRDSAATFDLSNISSRFVTPNDDGKNDFIIFVFDNPNGADVAGTVFDLRGAKVADMAAGPIPDRKSLQWDGKMNGKAATSGVYVYQIKGDGKTFNGTVVVAR
ncbi:MAG TPA: hypothetical protein DD417_02645 [Elusimicrobia bacterium]|nr:hypothetical protein [Elusimicrobiota bacterium]